MGNIVINFEGIHNQQAVKKAVFSFPYGPSLVSAENSFVNKKTLKAFSHGHDCSNLITISRFFSLNKYKYEDFPVGTLDRNLPANVGAGVQSLVKEDSTCYRVTKPKHYND